MRVFWTGIKRACAHAFRANAPLLHGETKALLGRSALGEVALREALAVGELDSERDSLGLFLNSAVELHTEASLVIGFFEGRRSLELAQVFTCDVGVNARLNRRTALGVLGAM